MKVTNESIQKPKKGNRSAQSKSTMADASVAPPDSESPLAEEIAVAAYYRAEQRGFAPGGELDDWLQAEAAHGVSARPNAE
jgi:hypothetical protein